MLNRHAPWHALKKYTGIVKMGQGARAFPARAPIPFLLFSVASPIVNAASSPRRSYSARTRDTPMATR